jgi:hypothetical protein
MYWSSDVSGDNGVNLYITAAAVDAAHSNQRAYGFSVRPIKDY